ncbi:MAG TPA: 30S ribosome-binding factor RbfA [Rectinemataceae bacterium]|nr:30S ribosome-binding factor RbfA [Rectinemataceae bacterium]
MDEIRRRRVEEELRDMIAALIMGGEIKDPRVGPFVSVTRVEVARDLSAARVFVSAFAGGENAGGTEPASETLDSTVAGLQHAAGFIQAQLGKRLKTRLTPRLHFIPDRGIKEGFELTERIKELFP